MRRRDFIKGIVGSATAWPLAAWAQQRPVMPVIGYLHPGVMPVDSSFIALTAIRQGLREGGFVEGQNLIIEYRWAGDDLDRLPELAADLVRRKVAVIVTTGLIAATATKAATSSIPSVFMTPSDPVEYAIVASLRRPGGNLTGATLISTGISSKRLDLLLYFARRAK